MLQTPKPSLILLFITVVALMIGQPSLARPPRQGPEAGASYLIRAFGVGEVNGVAFSPDGTLALIGGSAGVASLLDLATGAVIRSFGGHTDDVVAVAFSPDGDQILTGSEDKTARLWQASTGETNRIFTKHFWEVRAVAFSPDGRQILTGSGGRIKNITSGTARLWETNTGQLIQIFRHAEFVDDVAFSPDGNHILTGSADKTARLWPGKYHRLFLPVILK